MDIRLQSECKMGKECLQIADRNCTVYKSEQPNYLLIQPIDEHDLEVLDNEVETMLSLTDKPFTLAAFEIKDWLRELTPWAAPAAFGKIPFGDGADTTLTYIKDILIPKLEQMHLYAMSIGRLLFGRIFRLMGRLSEAGLPWYCSRLSIRLVPPVDRICRDT